MKRSFPAYALLLMLFILVIQACQSDSAINTKVSDDKQSDVAIRFRPRDAAQTGITFQNSVKEDLASIYNVLGYQYLYNGGGVGSADFNNDGLLDLYFTGNTVSDQLYINTGDLTFKRHSAPAVDNDKTWSHGVSIIDINNDGWLDIYVCKGGPTKDPEQRRNKLYINQGNLSFTEQSEQYGLDDSRISIQAAFLDYDKDGDLDCFVMNNAVYGSGDFNGNAERSKDPRFLDQSSSQLYENINGKYVNRTAETGLMRMSYGLGLMVQDFNNDGWPDIYISNDYYLPDAMYINQGDGTFRNEIKSRTGHTAFYGMGADAADINQDGHVDFLTLDMSSNDHVRSKTLMPPMNVDLFYTLTDYYKYHHQYMYNALQLNHGDGTYSNIAQMAGIANTDWSWSTLWADYDLDGWPDNYVTNGIKRYLNDNDFRKRMEDLAAEQRAGRTLTNEDKIELYESMPQLDVTNFAYRNTGDLGFEDVSESWNLEDSYNSNGAVYADLDNDGDLDIVVNNLDQPAAIYENNASEKQNFLKVKVPYNQLGISLRIVADGRHQYVTYQNVRGYQSCVPNQIVFGLAAAKKVDSLIVSYPNGVKKLKTNIAANSTIDLSRAKIDTFYSGEVESLSIYETDQASSVGIDFVAVENRYNDLEKEVLLPYFQSTRGPYMSKADVNGNGRDDIFIGGPANTSGALFIQGQDGKFNSTTAPFEADKASEDWASQFFDADGDGDMDLYVCSGGNEFSAESQELIDRLYINDGSGQFTKSDELPKIKQANATVIPMDIDSDGDMDIFIGGRQQAQSYPRAVSSYILKNENGRFLRDESNDQVLSDLGMVNDAILIDLDGDNVQELITVSEWGSVHVLSNNEGRLQNVSDQWRTSDMNGWWQSITADDWDGDGDTDLLVGNFGLNSKYAATKKKPLRLYSGDFDENGSHDLVLSKRYKGEYVPVRGLQCSSEQMPEIAERFSSYKAFAEADIENVLDIKSMDDNSLYESNTMESGILINEGGYFTFKPLPKLAQSIPFISAVSDDVDADGLNDIILFGNIYNTEVETPRLDAKSGIVLINQGNNIFEPMTNTGINISGNVKRAMPLTVNGNDLILVSRNNASLQVLRKID